jgi:RNA polymerase sigma-70 factor, ECF subfamily
VPASTIADASTEVTASREPDELDRLYTEHFDFVWRSLRRLGVQPPGIDDAVQDVFIVMLRRHAEFRRQSSYKTWLFGIASNVAREYRRKHARAADAAPISDTQHAASGPGPLEQASSAEALRLIERFLETLDEPKRDVFILAELEQLSAPEIADALGVKLNTVYSRLRVAREAFTHLIQQHYADEP